MLRSSRRAAAIIVLALVTGVSAAGGAGSGGDSARGLLFRLTERGTINFASGVGGGQMDNRTCSVAGNPAADFDISCDDTWSPENESPIVANPENPNHLVAGSNDYQIGTAGANLTARIPTGYFVSFDGGATWRDGQIPMGNGSSGGNGDPVPAFNAKFDTVHMAQLSAGCGSFCGHISVSVATSLDGGLTWKQPVTVAQGVASLTPSRAARFNDKEWMTVDNNPDSPHYGRIYVTATKFVNTLFGGYDKSPIAISWSDDGGHTFTRPQIISGAEDKCSFQSTGTGTDCDEDQFSIPEVASDGTVYVHFLNFQNEDEWEVVTDFDSTLMVTRSTDGGESWTTPVRVAELEDGLSDMPWTVIGRQSPWGHQIRWNAWGNISVNPNDPDDVVVVWADRDEANPNATDACIDEIPGEAPDYDPCEAGPGSDTDVRLSRSTDGGETWGDPVTVSDAPGHQWFPWADHLSDGSLAIGWDEDTTAAPADTFVHVLWQGSADGDGSSEVLGPEEHVDVSVTHWTGQYVPQSAWPAACGPAGYSDGSIADAEGKDCNVFHGDYTGLAVGPDDAVHVVWTGLNRLEQSPQVDPYTGGDHDGYAQDAMYARR